MEPTAEHENFFLKYTTAPDMCRALDRLAIGEHIEILMQHILEKKTVPCQELEKIAGKNVIQRICKDFDTFDEESKSKFFEVVVEATVMAEEELEMSDSEKFAAELEEEINAALRFYPCAICKEDIGKEKSGYLMCMRCIFEQISSV